MINVAGLQEDDRRGGGGDVVVNQTAGHPPRDARDPSERASTGSTAMRRCSKSASATACPAVT